MVSCDVMECSIRTLFHCPMVSMLISSASPLNSYIIKTKKKNCNVRAKENVSRGGENFFFSFPPSKRKTKWRKSLLPCLSACFRSGRGRGVWGSESLGWMGLCRRQVDHLPSHPLWVAPSLPPPQSQPPPPPPPTGGHRFRHLVGRTLLHVWVLLHNSSLRKASPHP